MLQQKAYKKRWAQLIHQVYEVDPLICTVCGGKMRIISYIEEEEVIKKILKHLNLWEEDAPPVKLLRSPPEEKKGDYKYELFDDASWCL